MRERPGKGTQSMTTKRGVSLILVAFLMTGCSKAMEIPRAEYDAASRDKARFKIKTVDGGAYDVASYTMTDSTIVATIYQSSDFRTRPTEVVEIPISSVATLSKYELARGPSFFLLAGGFIVIMLVYSLYSLDVPSS